MLFIHSLLSLVFVTFAIASDGFYKLDFDVLQGKDLLSALRGFLEDALTPRDASAMQLTNERSFYVAKVQVGTPPQEISVLLDTGSADLWITGSNNPHCLANGGDINCEAYGSFNTSESSTYHDNQTAFSIKYMDNTYAKGDWATETISLSEQLNLTDASLAVANDANSSVGVFGIGFSSLESQQNKYYNLPMLLKSQGLISSNAYSLYLTSAEATYGSVLFGGVDHAKYDRELLEIDIPKVNNDYLYLQIPLKSVTVQLSTQDSSACSTPATTSSTPIAQPTLVTSTLSSGSQPTHSGRIALEDLASEFASGIADTLALVKSGSKGFPSIHGSKLVSGNKANSNISSSGPSSISSANAAPSSSPSNSTIPANDTLAILDSGTTLSFLPTELVTAITSQLGENVTYNSAAAAYSVPCSLGGPGNNIVFGFENKDIQVPLSQLVYQTGQDPKTGKSTCTLGLIPSAHTILGDNFLRSCYTVFNLDKKTISIAQIKYTSDENIQVL